jgi:hypothetical protein
MKAIFLGLVLILITMPVHNEIAEKNADAQDMVDFLEAFFLSTLNEEATEINNCIDESIEVIFHIRRLIHDLKENFFEKIINVTKDLIAIVRDAKAAVKDCKQVPSHLGKYEIWVTELKDMDLMEDRFYHAFYSSTKEIKDDIKAIADGFTAEKFAGVGKGLGDFMVLIMEKSAEEHSGYVKDQLKVEQD